jgi:UDP-N-acetylmuramoyl-L-alanyl-D-glutamate--2,6-diaminopimelate ligase
MSYAKPLSALLELIDVHSNADLLIEDICLDSRKVTTGSLFLAYPGVANDGRDFIRAALENGAVAVVYESLGYDDLSGLSVPAFGVVGLQRKIGLLASAFFDYPSEDLQVFGVTGTNGKTTCAYLLAQSFELMGMKSAFIGTIGIGPVSAIKSATHTTPDPISLQRCLAEMVSENITQVCMEVSSHALHQSRVVGLNFYCVLFTNLTQDHLDYHTSMEDYGAAKAKLFTEFASELAVINADDQFGQSLIERSVSDFIVSYGEKSGDIHPLDLVLTTKGIEFTLIGNGVDFDIESPLIGKVNVPNLLLVCATLPALSTPVEQIQMVFKQLHAAPGRMELFTAPHMPQLVVDYAHTPDALSKALQSVAHHCVGDLYCVFGCGGDRDRGKRVLMGQAVEALAQCVIITNDNPRSESPEAIAQDILQGFVAPNLVLLELDRAAAIRLALERAKPSDWVLIAGKGHEITQTIGDEVYPFSDRELAAELVLSHIAQSSSEVDA